MKVYLLQFSPLWENKEHNFAQVRVWLKSHSIDRGSLLVLPETFSTGFSLNSACTLSNEPEKTEGFLSEIAENNNAWVLGGSIRPDPKIKEKGQNCAALFDPTGKKVGSYAKTHLFSPSGEREVHTQGNEVSVFDIGGLNFCPLICYDLRFPELFRSGVEKGAEAFAVLACWPKQRTNHWKVLLQARAIENQSYVIGVNRTGEEPGVQYAGNSMIIDPKGSILCEASAEEALLEADLIKNEPKEWRKSFPALSDRREDLF